MIHGALPARSTRCGVEATTLAQGLLEPIPANDLLGVRVSSAIDGTAAVAMVTRRQVTNVIGSLHSSGLIALADAAGLAALVSVAGDAREFDGVVPLGAAAEMQFHAPARGGLIAYCTLADSDASRVRAFFSGTGDRVTATTIAAIHDAEHTLVTTGTFHWSLRRDASSVVS
jgi:uncharacterized protein (TIGR00369 family)